MSRVHNEIKHQSQSVKKSILQKTMQVGSSTLLSRLLGLAREILMVRYLGPSNPLSDAFITAFKLPNSLRKVFAEGALSAAFIPTVVKLVADESQEAVNKLMSLAFIVVQGILFALCILIFWKAESVIRFIAPGWYLVPGAVKTSSSLPLIGSLLEWVAPAWYVVSEPVAQAQSAIPLVRLLIGFIVLLSSSALLTGALQAVNHFFVPAFGPVLLNIVFILGIYVSLLWGYPVDVLCYFILAGGLIQFLLHLYMYYKLNFAFSWQLRSAWPHFQEVLTKFFPCLLSMSIMEINLFVSTSLASYLPKGSISLIYYANRFMGIPLGVFAVAFSTILLPHFARIKKEGVEHFSFYIYEAAKLILWVTLPVTLIMSILSHKIFATLFLSKNFTMVHVHEAAIILIIFLSCLFFFSLNKVLLNVYYALHDTRTPVVVSLAAAVSNYLLSKFMLHYWGIYGLVFAFVCAGSIQTLFYLFLLHNRLGIVFNTKEFISFARNAFLQILAGVSLFAGFYYGIAYIIAYYLPVELAEYATNSLAVWLWVFPLIGLTCAFLYNTRNLFNVTGHFLE